jgi:hypothetical protein
LRSKNNLKVLKDASLNTREKIDNAVDRTKPLFLNGNGGEAPSYLTRLIITPYKDNVVFTKNLLTEDGKKIYGMTYAGWGKYVLYTAAYPEFGNYTNNRVIFRVKHPEDYSLDSTSINFRRRTKIIYESMFTPRSPDSAQLLFRSHLRETFGMTLDSEIIEKPCLVISKVSGKYKSIASKATTVQTNWWQYDGRPITIIGMPFQEVIGQINYDSKTPVIDETGISGYVDLQLPRNLNDLRQLRSYLQKIGLKIDLLPRKLSYAVFSEPEFLKNQPIANR